MKRDSILFTKIKTLTMKKITLILKSTLNLFASIGITFSICAQATGDYRSAASGNWNDVTKWEMYDGNNWVNATSYPGQNSGTAAVTILTGMEIKITAAVPQPISALTIMDSITQDHSSIVSTGALTFSSANPVSLNVQGDVTVFGSIQVADQNGAKNHSLTIGGSLMAGTWGYNVELEWCDYSCVWSYCYGPLGGDIQTRNNDDVLGVIFNTTKPNSLIGGANAITFQDITFNGIGISVETSVYINGAATFINGIVNSFSGYCDNYCGEIGTPDDIPPPPSCSAIFFNDGAIAFGASGNSFVNGNVWKQGNDSFTFPIYVPLTISAPIDSKDVFMAYYARGQLDRAIGDTGLRSVSNCEYWLLNPGYPSYNGNLTTHLDVTAGWNPSSGCRLPNYITNVPNVTLAHLNNDRWDSHGGSGEGTATNGSVTWRQVSNFGIFALGNVNTNCVTPSALGATNITLNSATLNWSSIPGSVGYDVSYKPSTTYNWITAATTASTSIDLTGLDHSTSYDWKVKANCGPSSLSLYRLAAPFTTLYPCGTPSGLMATNITPNNAILSWNAVANAVSYGIQYKQSASDYWLPIPTGVVNTPSYNLSGISTATSYDWRVFANCSEGPGNYAQASFTTPACIDVYESNNSSSEAKSLTLGRTITAMIPTTTDVDWFKVTMPNNSNTTLQATLSNLPADYDLYVYNKNLSLVASSTSIGTANEAVVYSSRTRNASYYIKVVGKNGAYNAIQCYNLLAQAVGGSVTTSATKALDEMTSTTDKQLLFPNPASEFVYLHFNSNVQGFSDVQILNSVGQLVKSSQVNVVEGINHVNIRVNDLKPGMYILKINDGKTSIMRKFVVAR
jgi:type IX secretion system substrate protein/fibronectin type III domain protein